jgi:DNA gyrase subunit A
MVSRSARPRGFEEGKVRSMGRATAGVRGMNVSQKDNAVLVMDVARPDQDLLVVTENGYGKRTAIDDYPIKGRGTMGVKTIALTDKKGALAGALVVREHQELVFISQNGMVQRTAARGINRYGRASQGVRVMNVREDDASAPSRWSWSPRPTRARSSLPKTARAPIWRRSTCPRYDVSDIEESDES